MSADASVPAVDPALFAELVLNWLAAESAAIDLNDPAGAQRLGVLGEVHQTLDSLGLRDLATQATPQPPKARSSDPQERDVELIGQVANQIMDTYGKSRFQVSANQILYSLAGRIVEHVKASETGTQTGQFQGELIGQVTGINAEAETYSFVVQGGKQLSGSYSAPHHFIQLRDLADNLDHAKLVRVNVSWTIQDQGQPRHLDQLHSIEVVQLPAFSQDGAEAAPQTPTATALPLQD